MSKFINNEIVRIKSDIKGEYGEDLYEIALYHGGLEEYARKLSWKQIAIMNRPQKKGEELSDGAVMDWIGIKYFREEQGITYDKDLGWFYDYNDGVLFEDYIVPYEAENNMDFSKCIIRWKDF